MIKVGELLRKKGHQVWSIDPDASVLDALSLMAEKNVGALVVTQADQVAGIFSERDYARCVVLKGRTTEDTRVREVMTENVVFIHPNQSLVECMTLMTDKHIRHLPVVHEGRLQGLISIGDVVKEIISEQEFTIHNLENYITGGKA